MIIITNRALEAATGFTHPQIKRWAVSFLDADKASGQHSGIPRTYSFEQAVRIYLGGYLVRNLTFKLIEAKQIIDDVTGWLKEKGWSISEWVNFEASTLSGGYVVETNFPWMDLKVDIGVGGQGRFFYHVKILIVRKKKKETATWQDTYNLEFIGSRFIDSKGPFRSINMVSLVNSLAIRLAQKGSE
jgi:hypothetical protein